MERPHKGVTKRPQGGETEKALASVVEVIEVMTSQTSQVEMPREEAPKPSPVLLEVSLASPSIGASNPIEMDRVLAPPTSHTAMKM